MGLPMAQQLKREQLRAIESVATGSVNADNKPVILPALQPVMVSPTEVTSQEAVANTSTTVQEELVTQPVENQIDWRTRAEESDNRWRASHGIHKKLMQENDQLKNELSDLRSIVNDLRSSSDKAKQQEEDLQLQLTPEEELTYNDSVPVIEKVSRRQVRQIEELYNKRLEAIENKLSVTGQKFEDVGSNLFNKEVQKEISDFNEIINNPKWVDYLSQKTPYSRDTFATRLTSALEQRDVETTVEILKGFKNTQKTGNLNSMVSPSIKSTERVNTNGNQKPILKGSTYKSALTDFTKGRYSGSAERLKQFRDMADQYKQADRENRVDWNT